ncbi:hypothetical protein [Bradyrhizobium sp.]|jgi:hypothetical protein|uniref:hypothetical protein n=1 Tax=Bradyrhizobium sp. TaxID=376 RepID=UPI003C199852
MKKLIVAAAFALVSASPALASHYDITFHGTQRPAGHHRSLAVAKAASASCFTQTGTSPEDAPTQAYKDCMNAQGFRWIATKLLKDPPAKHEASGIPAGHFIDSDTGMLCRNSGGAAISVPPPNNMTVRYTSKHGLNCTRTGAMSICSNL